MIYDRTSPELYQPKDGCQLRAILAARTMAATPPQTQLEQSHADIMTRVGAWLFRHRTVIPIPLALAILATPASRAQPSVLVGVGSFRVRAQSSVCGQRRPVGRIRRERSTAVARTSLCGDPGIRISRHRALGRTAARGEARREVPNLYRTGAALGTKHE